MLERKRMKQRNNFFTAAHATPTRSQKGGWGIHFVQGTCDPDGIRRTSDQYRCIMVSFGYELQPIHLAAPFVSVQLPA